MTHFASIVEQVKAWQKMSEGHKNGWYHFAVERGTTDFDPNRHEESTLTEFLTMANSGRIDIYKGAPEGVRTKSKDKWSGGSKWGGSSGASWSNADPASVEQVKAWKKLSDGHKNAWYNFVIERGLTHFDPKRHDESTLTEFLTMANSGQIDTTQETPLVVQVKAWQKMSEGHRNSWYHFVLERGATDFDPNRHEESTLTEFLAMASSGQIDITRGAPPGVRSRDGKGDGKGKWSGGGYPSWEDCMSMMEMMLAGKGNGKGCSKGKSRWAAPY